jgi:ATP/ADP translocase
MSDDMLIMLGIVAGAVVLVAVSWPTSAKSAVRLYVGKIGDSIAAIIGWIVFTVVAMAFIAWLLGANCEWQLLPPSPFHLIPCD